MVRSADLPASAEGSGEARQSVLRTRRRQVRYAASLKARTTTFQNALHRGFEHETVPTRLCFPNQRTETRYTLRMFFRKPQSVVCAVCGKTIGPKERRF